MRMDRAGTSNQCSSTPGPSLSHSPGPVSNKSEVWKKEGSVASKVM